MAIYQFQLTLIPRKGIIEKFGLLPERLDIDYEERKNYYHLKKDNLLDKADKFKDALVQDWWSTTALQPVEVVHQIDKKIRRANYGNDIWIVWKFYSLELDNDASMLINGETGKIAELQFRADLRENNLKFLQEMVKLAHDYDWLLMDLNGNLVNPEMKEIVGLIKNSNAYKFLQDPTRFLTGLGEGENEIV